MARSVVDENVTVDGEVWHDSFSEPGWKWKGDTSSDEVVGHMFAYTLIYDLITDGDETLKDEVMSLVDDIIGKFMLYVVANILKLVPSPVCLLTYRSVCQNALIAYGYKCANLNYSCDRI